MAHEGSRSPPKIVFLASLSPASAPPSIQFLWVAVQER